MKNNNFGAAPQDLGLEAFLKGYDEAISHYDFVIKDLSSEIYNPTLRAGQPQAVAYLTAMRNEWQKHRDAAQAQIDALKRNSSGK